MPPQHRRRRRGPSLRWGTQNARSLGADGNYRLYGGKARLLAKSWTQQRLDVVCITECNITKKETAAIEKNLPGWELFWACPNRGTRQAKTAIAIRRRLIQEGARVSDVRHRADGRVLTLQLDWGGHRLQVASVYMPADRKQQPDFIQKFLAPLLRAGPPKTKRIWGGISTLWRTRTGPLY